METNQSALQNDDKLLSSESNTKLCEISSDEDVKSKQLTLESLPPEMFIEILDFLSWNDLLNATLVSKQWNTIISNSSKLLNKIEFVYKQWNYGDNWSGSRKYQNIEIQCRETKEPFSLRFDKESVKVLTLNIRDINFNELRKFLLEFVNLEELCIICVYFDESNKFEILPLPKRNLKKLTLKSDNSNKTGIDQLINLFTDWRVNQLLLDFHGECFENPNVVKFLMNQNYLEHLDINYADLGQLKDAKFQLKSLKARFLKDNGTTDLGKFIQNHRNSLTEFEIYAISDEIAKILNKFTKFKKLTVWYGRISKKLKCSTIESLKLYDYDSDHSFPFVKELYLNNCRLTTIEEMKYLHKLTICNKYYQLFSIPTVKILVLYNVRDETRPFKFETSNLDELEIIDSYGTLKWVIDYLDRAETQLKKFKIKNISIKPELTAAIERNCSKIKCFETVNCKEAFTVAKRRKFHENFPL